MPTVRIGIYSPRVKEETLQQWSPLQHYLNRSISGYRFELVPLLFDEALPAVSRYEVDLLIANPTLYVYASVEGAQPVRIMATLARRQVDGLITSEMGGVLFARNLGSGEPELSHFKGGRLAAVNEHAFGGWLAVRFELEQLGLYVSSYFSSIDFAGSGESVVEAVRSGEVDLGVVRCGTLERVAAAGAVSLDEFYVFPLNAEEGALLCSTPLYPEWVLCRLAGISDALAKDILAALWAVGHDEVLAKSSGVGEWSLPLDYHSVRVCLREMRLGPYKTYMRRMTPLDRMFWSWYWRWILAAFLALGGLLIVVIIILRLNRRLVVARNNAQSADRAKSEFLANMSHEIRTPLNAVLGLSDLMMETELTELQSDYVKTIYSSSEALFAIINNILDISKIDADKLELECVEFDMRHCLESSLNVVAAGAQLKGLAMVCDIDSKLPVQVWGDFSRLRQVLLNLLSNAVKFTERGHVMLQAEAVAGEGGATLFKICISDTGIGMSADQIKRIFAPFSQADSSTTRRYGGTGLGLSISKKIIDLMGGRIVVRSEEGRGSCFELLIPLELGKTVESVFLQEKVECLQGLRVLLVDHYKPRALVVDKQLQFWGMATARVDNHREALAILESGEQFDLIILDSTVAERCGEEKCSYLKEAADALGAKVILMVFKDVVRSDLFETILNKPVTAENLFTRVTRALCASAASGCCDRGSDDPDPSEESFSKEVDLTIRILVVDDVRVNLKVAQRMCERLGYQSVDAVTNGKEALIAVAENEYDVILMDVQMPEMDGLQATKCICSQFPSDKRPVIIGMTANAMLEDREECYAVGMSDYISKPVQSKMLAAALARIQRRR